MKSRRRPVSDKGAVSRMGVRYNHAMETRWEKLTSPRLCALAGRNPTQLSAAMHNAAYLELGAPFTYVAINSENTAAVIAAMRAIGIRGLSLTIPHKEAACALVDELSAEGAEIGAINTAVNFGSRIIGYNTDCHGISAALAEGGLALGSRPALVLGAGGAAKAALRVLTSAGAACWVANRTSARAEAAAGKFSCNALGWEEVGRFIKENPSLLIINATTLGSHLAPQGADFPFDLAKLSKGCDVLDMATARETALLRACSSAGGTAISGLRMLLHQAVKQVELFTENAAPIKAMEEALYRQI